VLTNIFKRMTTRRWLAAAGIALLAAQLLRIDRTNPPVDPAKTVEAGEFSSPAVNAILARSCKGCHSNETVWPWYSQVAPVSWVIAYDVDRARRYLNLSTWANYKPRRALVWVETACRAVQSGRMPLGRYVWAHPEAALSDSDRQVLCDWASRVEKELRSRAD